MSAIKAVVILLTGGLIALNTIAAEAPERPLHILYLGPVSADSGGLGGRGTNYVYLPGQTLAPEAIYFDHVAAVTNLTDTYLKHFDAVVQVTPDAEVGAARQKMLDTFKTAGNGLIKYTVDKRPTDAVLREAVLATVSRKARTAWEAFLGSRPPLQRQP